MTVLEMFHSNLEKFHSTNLLWHNRSSFPLNFRGNRENHKKGEFVKIREFIIVILLGFLFKNGTFSTEINLNFQFLRNSALLWPMLRIFDRILILDNSKVLNNQEWSLSIKLIIAGWKTQRYVSFTVFTKKIFEVNQNSGFNLF